MNCSFWGRSLCVHVIRGAGMRGEIVAEYPARLARRLPYTFHSRRLSRRPGQGEPSFITDLRRPTLSLGTRLLAERLGVVQANLLIGDLTWALDRCHRFESVHSTLGSRTRKRFCRTIAAQVAIA